MKKYLIVLGALIMLLTGCETENAPFSESGEAYSYAPSSVPESAPPQEISADSEDHDMDIEITVNGQTFSAELYDNDTARAFKEKLPLTLEMKELNGNEKFFYLPESLPTAPIKPSEIHTGDIMLYGDNCLVIFYEDFRTTYSYTPIGKTNAPEGLANALGSGDIQLKVDSV